MHQPPIGGRPGDSSGHAPGYAQQGYGPPAPPPPRRQIGAGVIVLIVAGCVFGSCVTCTIIGGVVGVVTGTTSTSGGQSPDVTVPAPGLDSAKSSGATTARVVETPSGAVDAGGAAAARHDAAATGEPPISRVASPEPASPITELSRRAHLAFRVRRDEAASRQAGRDINRQPTRAEVVEDLGPATWAALPSDKGGDFALEGSSSVLDLYWRNGDCTPVMVSFDKSMHAIGSDEGRMCVGGQDVNPGARFSCTQHDRQKLCR